MQLTNKVRLREAHSFHRWVERSVDFFGNVFVIIFTRANILKSGKYVEKSSVHHDPCLSGHQL